jgi:hypothetical protein
VRHLWGGVMFLCKFQPILIFGTLARGISLTTFIPSLATLAKGGKGYFFVVFRYNSRTCLFVEK